MIRQRKLIIPIIIVLLTAAVSGQESFSTARELYAAAEYEEALSMLNRLRTAPHPPTESRGIDQYRAFCLLALGRASDAERAIEAVVMAEPSYQPSEAEVSPRLRSAFSDVRKRMLPGIIQDQYTRAKVAFDQKNYEVAAITFREMLTTLADPAVGAAATQPPLSDLRTLATGFHELSAAAVAPPPKPAPALPAPPRVLAVATPSAPPPPVLKIYTLQDADVKAPTIIRQSLPEYDKSFGRPVGQGKLEIVINESGLVEQVLLRGTIHPRYDGLAMEAARTWRYKPATLNGVPVKYSKAIAVDIKL